MNVSLKWLATLVDVKGLDTEMMAERLTVDGIPVEHIRYPGQNISGVKTGRILNIERHPDANHLVICQLDVAEERPVQIVTGASNVRVGQIVPVALPGAHLPAKHDASAPGGLRYGKFKIKASKLRGIPSAGMLCSCGELGLDDNLFPEVNKEGIMILPEITEVGVDFHTLYDLDDCIYEMELTANRGDCFSMIGMAYEVGAIFKREVSLPKVQVKEDGVPIFGRATVKIEDSKYCKRFCSRILDGVRVGRSPGWIENRLRSNGIRPINNIVDAANYVMLETGQPLHTYDYDKVAGHMLFCRHAKEGETIRTLDDVERKLLPSDLVIADEEGPSCIAGVMGGLHSEVTEATKTVLLEAAVFDSASVRRTSRRMGLRSEASGRYERGVNPKRTEEALNRICQMLQEQGACTVAPNILDEYPGEAEPQVLYTSADAINEYIGISLPDSDIVDILTRLRFDVKEVDGQMSITVPDFRADIEGMPDLAEEVARVYGYENIPNTTPWSAIVKGTIPFEKEVLMTLQDIFLACGLSQVENYSFMDKRDLVKWNISEKDSLYEAIPIINPISEEYPVMRTTLLPGLMHTLKRNLALKNEDVAIFETGVVYQPHELPLTELPEEEMMAGALFCGHREEATYPVVGRTYDFYDVKGIMENLLRALGIKGYTIRRSTNSSFHPGISAEFVKDDVLLATFGEIHPLAADAWGIKKKVYGCILSVTNLLPFVSHAVMFQRILKFPAVERDLALLVPTNVANEAVIRLIHSAGGKELEQLKLFDLYQGEQVPPGYKSMAYSLAFRKEEGTLTDEEVEPHIQAIIRALAEADITLRE